MLNIIIFSRDRAMQLSLLLNSLTKFHVNWNQFTWNILYTYSNDQYKLGYDVLKSRHPEFNYIKENSFKSDLLSLVKPTNKYTMFGVDDNVFKEPFNFSCPEIDMFYDNPDYMCVSLRMYPGINYCYSENRPTPPPMFESQNPYVWNWQGSRNGDWSYPFSVDFNLFRTLDILEPMNRINYWNPNTFEGYLANHPWNKSKMICFEKSKIIGAPINRVQQANGNRSGNVSLSYLNDMYLKGQVIDLTPIEGVMNVAPHHEIPVNFIKA